ADAGARHDSAHARRRLHARRAARVVRRQAARDSPRPTQRGRAQHAPHAAGSVAGALSLGQIFWIFLRAGLAFGGGLSILAVLEQGLVDRRRVLSRDEFLTTYALGRIVPSGTMTAVAVGFGHRLGGWAGTAAALLGLTLPAFVSTVALTAAYRQLQGTRAMALLSVSVLPAALAPVGIPATNLARSAIGRWPETVLAVAALIVALLFHVNPAIILLASGLGGALLLGPPPSA